MLRFGLLVAASCIALAHASVGASAAEADVVIPKDVSITNRDTVDRRLILFQGRDRATHQVAPGATLTLPCERGCIIQVDDDGDNPFRLEPGDVASIENGLMYDDKAAAQSR